MRNVTDDMYRKICIFGALFFLMGCASDPVPTQLPANHPANPAAAEAVFTSTPNPFQDKMSMYEMESMQAPSMPGAGDTGRHPHHLKPDRDNQEKPNKITTDKSDHSH